MTLGLVLSLLLGVKVAGVDFVPRDLIFAAAEPKSRATADGDLPNECKWAFTSETRIAKRDEGQGQGQGQGCVRYYYKTTVKLEQTCPAGNGQVKTVTQSSERITAAGPFCPDSSGKPPPPQTDARVLSSGTTTEGKHQDIVIQPDGTRIALTSDDASVLVVALYPDGTADTLKLPS